MALQNINPTQTDAWKKLSDHYNEVKKLHLKQLFREDKKRKERFTVFLNDLEVDYSKNLITKETIDLLLQLANEVELQDLAKKQILLSTCYISIQPRRIRLYHL